MVIDTTSREGMESSLAHLMGVSVPELYQYIEAAADSAVEGQWCFNQDLFDKAMEDFYSDMIEQELPDEILFFHLSRRLKGSENEISYNLQELLTSNNSFSEFLNAHQITFRKGAGNRIILCYRGRQIMRVKDKTAVLPEYLAAVLRSDMILSQTRHMMTGNTHPRISNDDVKNLYIPVPDMPKQQLIVEELRLRRQQARALKKQAEEEWKTAKEQFEKELLGE